MTNSSKITSRFSEKFNVEKKYKFNQFNQFFEHKIILKTK